MSEVATYWVLVALTRVRLLDLAAQFDVELRPGYLNKDNLCALLEGDPRATPEVILARLTHGELRRVSRATGLGRGKKRWQLVHSLLGEVCGWRPFSEARRWSDRELHKIFGPPPKEGAERWKVRVLPQNPSSWDLYDRLVIGEFVRRHHARLAHEISLYGFPGLEGGVEETHFPVLAETLPKLADLAVWTISTTYIRTICNPGTPCQSSRWR